MSTSSSSSSSFSPEGSGKISAKQQESPVVAEMMQNKQTKAQIIQENTYRMLQSQNQFKLLKNIGFLLIAFALGAFLGPRLLALFNGNKDSTDTNSWRDTATNRNGAP